MIHFIEEATVTKIEIKSVTKSLLGDKYKYEIEAQSNLLGNRTVDVI